MHRGFHEAVKGDQAMQAKEVAAKAKLQREAGPGLGLWHLASP